MNNPLFAPLRDKLWCYNRHKSPVGWATVSVRWAGNRRVPTDADVFEPFYEDEELVILAETVASETGTTDIVARIRQEW